MEKVCISRHENTVLTDKKQYGHDVMMDAIELYRDGIDRFVIASMDGDFDCFTPRLRANLCVVFGIGLRYALRNILAFSQSVKIIGRKSMTHVQLLGLYLARIEKVDFHSQNLEIGERDV